MDDPYANILVTSPPVWYKTPLVPFLRLLAVSALPSIAVPPPLPPDEPVAITFDTSLPSPSLVTYCSPPLFSSKNNVRWSVDESLELGLLDCFVKTNPVGSIIPSTVNLPFIFKFPPSSIVTPVSSYPP